VLICRLADHLRPIFETSRRKHNYVLLKKYRTIKANSYDDKPRRKASPMASTAYLPGCTDDDFSSQTQ